MRFRESQLRAINTIKCWNVINNFAKKIVTVTFWLTSTLVYDWSNAKDFQVISPVT